MIDRGTLKTSLVSAELAQNNVQCKIGLLKTILFFFFFFTIRATNHQMKGHQNIKLSHWTRLKTLEFIANSRFLKVYICFLPFNSQLREVMEVKRKTGRIYNADMCACTLYMFFAKCASCRFLLFFLHLCRYYSLEVSYFKSSLDRKLLEMLWNKYWVNTLSSSSLLTVSNKS